eukprot:7369568-Prymnesium_polylepis.3
MGTRGGAPAACSGRTRAHEPTMRESADTPPPLMSGWIRLAGRAAGGLACRLATTPRPAHAASCASAPYMHWTQAPPARDARTYLANLRESANPIANLQIH